MSKLAIVFPIFMGILSLATGCATCTKPVPFQERVGWFRRCVAEGEAVDWMSEIKPYALMSELAYRPDAPTGKKAANTLLVKKQAFRLSQRGQHEKWLADNHWVRVTNAASGLPMPADTEGLYFGCLEEHGRLQEGACGGLSRHGVGRFHGLAVQLAMVPACLHRRG